MGSKFIKSWYRELSTLVVLLGVGLFFFAAGGYWQWVMGYLYLYLIQGFVAWFLFFKCDQPFFGYSVTMAIGAYGTAVPVEMYGWQLVPSIFLGAGIASLAAVVIFVATSRARGFYVGMVSFLLAIMFPQLINALGGITGGRSGLTFTGLTRILGYQSTTLLVVLSATFFAGLLMMLMRTKVGKIFTTISENDDLTKAVGINTFKYKLLAYFISGLVSGLGGALYVNYTGAISSVDLGALTTIRIVFIPIVGGSGSVFGPFLGTLFIRLLPEAFRSVERFMTIFFGMAFLAVLIWLRGGLAGGISWISGKVMNLVGIEGIGQSKAFESLPEFQETDKE